MRTTCHFHFNILLLFIRMPIGFYGFELPKEIVEPSVTRARKRSRRPLADGSMEVGERIFERKFRFGS